MGLTIYNASAGSGKTYTLAAAYISKLLTEEGYNLHRYILAVTFTNKATAEMKARIMQWLWTLSQEVLIDTDFVLKMCEITPLVATEYAIREVDRAARILSPSTRKKLSKRADKALRELVHDYQHFSVTTIDSFFQRVLADVGYELKLPSSYKLNLDTEAVMDEAIEELLTTLEQDAKAYNWLRSYMQQQLDEDKTWNVRTALLQYGKRIFDERYLMFDDSVKQTMGNEEAVEAYQEAMESIMKTAEKASQQLAQQTLIKWQEEMEAEGVSIDMIPYSGSVVRSLSEPKEMSAWKIEQPINKHLYRTLTDEEGAHWKLKNKQTTTAGTRVMLDFVEKLRTLYMAYYSAKFSKQNLYPMRMMSILDHKVSDINDKHSQFMLAKVGPFLQQLSQATGDESSFVFQKTGTRYKHIMIDEFQDTSNLQWHNFQLLFMEVLANSNTALIVGDGKQSIYRFRNGDWRIMQGLGHLNDVSLQNLDTNYRSEPVIVTFNNTFFEQAATWLDETLAHGQITPLYASVAQQVRPDKPLHNGKVEISIININTLKASDVESTDITPYDEQVLTAMEQRILALQVEGVAFSDMAILVRRNSEASKIVTYFAHRSDSTLRFVSSEAFLLSASVVVNIIIHALRYACQRKDKVALAYLIKHYPAVSEATYRKATHAQQLHNLLPEGYRNLINTIDKIPLYEAIEQIMVDFAIEQHLIASDESERAYLYAFLDEVMRFLEVRSENVRGFLTHWDKIESKRSIPMESTDAIQVLTLHKSKGLEYHTVLMPYAHWPLADDRPQDFYWFETGKTGIESYMAMPWLPISQSPKLAHTIYAAQYTEEHQMQIVDNLNMLYVAFTRAKANLCVWSGVSYNASERKESTIALTTVGRLLHRWACTYLNKAWEKNLEEEQCNVVIDQEFGKRIIPNATAKKDTSPITNRLEVEHNVKKCTTRLEHFTQNNLSFLQSTEADRWIRDMHDMPETPNKHLLLDTGKVAHEVLASIHTLADAPEALTRLETNLGIKISDVAQREKVRHIVEACLEEPQAKVWFDNSWHLYNECSILETTPSGTKINRPDRVMVSQDGSHIIIVDFKTGKPQRKHQKQVAHYMRLMQQMHEQRRVAQQALGYNLPQAKIEGYLWYIGETYRKIEAVRL